MSTKEIHLILRALPATEPWALATLVHVAGSSYRRAGARLLLRADGTRVGSISGGCLEADVVARAQRVLAGGQPELAIYDTTSENDLVWGVGLGCHGVVRVLIERGVGRPTWVETLARHFAQARPTELAVVYGGASSALWGTYLASALPVLPEGAEVFCHTVPSPVPCIVCGAGDDAQPLVRLAKELGWHVTVIDPRAEFATAARFPTADMVIVARPEEIAARVPLDSRTVAIVMTHHYVHDLPLLRQLLPMPLAYLGLLGPKKRAERILADLAAAGFALSPEQRARLHAPIGLDLGGDTPEAVALAIVAEIQAVLAHRNARPLRERTQPIHG